MPRAAISLAAYPFVQEDCRAPRPAQLDAPREAGRGARGHRDGRQGPGAEADLQRYLTVHSEYAASGMKGPLPLAMLVGYGARR